MELYCTRPSCPHPVNLFADLDDPATLKRVPQKYCTTCGMPLILRDRYLPLKLLGQGGFGVAVLARDRDTPAMRQCVVKLFKPAVNLTLQQMQIAQNLFAREAEVLEQLGHQNTRIPQLYAFFELIVSGFPPGKQEQFFYLVQEYIDGRNLEDELAQKGNFSEDEIVDLLQEILPVLEFIHAQGSIHRDIKPSNIMRDGQGRLHLLDFGAVKQVTKVASSGSSKSSTGIYSMGFAPPEQMSGGEIYPSTDLYALAVTCLTLLTGKKPSDLFDSYTNKWDWRKYVQVSDPLANILERMLLATPNLRFQSAPEVLVSLLGNAASTARSQSSSSAVTLSPTAPTVSTTVKNRPPSAIRAFSTLELLANAGFSGMMAGLLGIILASLWGFSVVSLGIGTLILGGLIFAQSRRLIEKLDLVIIGAIALAIIWFIPFLHSGTPFFIDVMIVAIGAGLLGIAVTTLFRLIYKLLSLIL